MSRKKGKWRRSMAIMLGMAMIISQMQFSIYAKESAEVDTEVTGLCEHHPEHTAECGYVEEVAGHECNHEHTDECYTEGKELNCQHVHDEECGYIEAVEGHPCNFVCEICNAVPTNTSVSDNNIVAVDSAIGTVSGNQPVIDAIVISTPDELIDFATKINDTTYPANENAILTADIDMSGKEWTPIGDIFNRYAGTFDGKGHTIQNLSLNDSSVSYIGVFGYIEGATIRDLGVTGAFSGNEDVGGIVGKLKGSSTIENCWNGAEINGEGGNIGGIAGWLEAPGSIVNCYNYGTVTGLYDTGGIAGTIYGSNATVENCFNYGKIKKKTDDSTVHGIGQSYADALVKNCYYLADSELFDENAAPKEAEEFQSGEVTWLLNGESSDGVWKQTLPTDTYPNFTGKTVYKNNQDGYTNNKYNITLNATDGGSVSGAGEFVEGDVVTITATPNEGYHFVGWIQSGLGISTNVNHTFNIIADETYEAVFEQHTPEADDGDCTTAIKCSVCQAEVTPAKDAHNFTAETVSADYLKSEATCTAPAEYYKLCSVCGTSSKGIDDMATFTSGGTIPHTMTYHSAVEATCIAKGNVEYWTCSECNKNYDSADSGNVIADVVTAINPNNHDLVHHEAKAPTYTEIGWNAYDECMRAGCDYTTYAELPILVDDIAPTGKITVKENKWSSFINTITFGIFAKDKFDVTITAEDNETGVKSVEYFYSETPITEADIVNVTAWNEYAAFSLENEGKYIIYAKITDNSNNVTYISSDGMVVDKTAPVTTGLSVTDITADSAKFSFKLDEAGTCYYLVKPTTETAPTQTELLASANKLTAGEENFADMNGTLSGLTENTEYTLYLLAEDKAKNTAENGNISAVVSVNFKTEKIPRYMVTVTGGTGSGEYREGESVTITADTPAEGKQFKEWTGADGIIFTSGSAISAEATFTMPANAVSVTATYEDIPVVDDTEYEITAGDNQTVKENFDGTITITCNGELSKFVSVSVDGKTVGSKYYTLKSGSTILTFTKEYVASLSVGTHVVRFEYTDGYAETNLTITKADDTDDKPGKDSDEDLDEKESITEETPIESPKTGDDTPLELLIVLFVSSFAGVIFIEVYRKKRKTA